MKYTLFTLFVASSLVASAQTPFMTMDSLNVNNINALALVHGDMWWNPGTAKAHCKFPKNAQKSVGFAASLWMSGYDGGGQLHVAAQTYRQDGNDYWPGPLDGTGSIDYATSTKWAKIWKVSRDTINAFLALPMHTTANTPQSILTWPGKGNTYAAGNGGAALVVSTDMAPFKDLNANGVYEPLNGEYPDFHGEQALWWLFSDNGPTHTQTQGQPLKTEIRVLAYAYKRGNPIDNVVYYDYTIVNRSAENYTDFRLALWSDVDLGYYLDDYVGFDSVRRMGITYNSSNDDGASGGHPAGSYGVNPPVVGVVLVQLPGDVAGSPVAAGSFLSYSNDTGILGNPAIDTEFNHYMHGRFRNGQHLQYGGIDRNYSFPDDPSVTGGWSECAQSTTPGDRRYVITTNGFTLNAGSTQKVVMAMAVDSAGSGCPGVNFGGVKIIADSAWTVFNNPLPPITVALPRVVTVNNEIRVYPNPARNELYVDCGAMTNAAVELSIYNVVGQKVLSASAKAGGVHALSVVALPAGVYYLRYSDDGVVGKVMFVKE